MLDTPYIRRVARLRVVGADDRHTLLRYWESSLLPVVSARERNVGTNMHGRPYVENIVNC